MSETEKLIDLMKTIVNNCGSDGNAYMLVECIARNQWPDAISNGKKSNMDAVKTLVSAIDTSLSGELKESLINAAMDIITEVSN